MAMCCGLLDIDNTEYKTAAEELKRKINEYFWNDFEHVINNYVDSVTLQDIARRDTEFIGFEYCI